MILFIVSKMPLTTLQFPQQGKRHMLNSEQAAQIVSIANAAKNHQDQRTAHLAFLGLMNAVISGNTDGSLSLEYEKSDHPYYDVYAIVVGEKRLRLPRPMLTTAAYELFFPKAKVVALQKGPRRPKEKFVDHSAQLDAFNLSIQEDWLLEGEGDKDEKLWMTADEYKEYIE